MFRDVPILAGVAAALLNDEPARAEGTQKYYWPHGRKRADHSKYYGNGKLKPGREPGNNNPEAKAAGLTKN